MRLDELLAEDPRSAERRQAQAFNRAADPFEGRIVIYGAGGLGQRVLRGLRANHSDALAFVDRNPASWDTVRDGLPVLSPQSAAQQFAHDSVFVIAVWNPSGGQQAIANDLTAMGCRRVVPFSWLFWKYPQEFLPYYLWDLPSRILESAAEVRRAFALFPGARSQDVFLRHLEFRLTGDFSVLTPPDAGEQYFPDRLFRPREDECFVDCGAYDGDTLRALAEWTGGRFRRAIAFEADPQNFAALERSVSADARLHGRVKSVQEAVGGARSKLRFAASGLASAALSATGEIEVQCSPLDESLSGEHPTYIKMDIEGAEMDALQGAAAVLERDRPTLAICAYHVQDHLWQIPQRIHELQPDARLLLRPHCADGFDLVCYAIPAGRSLDLALEEYAQ